MQKSKRTKRLSTAALLLILTACIAVTVCTSLEIAERQSKYAEARAEYDKLRDIAIPPAEGEDEEGIDFDALRAINPGVVGWIEVPGSRISYPIVQGSCNRHYLHHTFSGTRNASGAIFLDYRDQLCTIHYTLSTNDPLSTIRIYGHNMRDGSMFNSLLNWRGDRFIIHTPESVMEVAVTFRGALPLTEIVAIDGGVVLVTCVNGRPDVRFVVLGEVV